MIIAISYHDGDLDLMTRWANHVQKLGPYLNHHLVLLPVHGVNTTGIEQRLSGSFSKISIETCHHVERGWPISCNKAFETMAWAAYQKYKQPFLWMEPDAVPLKQGWLNDIENDYRAKGRPFMGDYVAIAGVMPNGVDHMSGIAVYHPDMPRLAPSIFNNERAAWDIASAYQVTRQMARTNLIQHDWIPTKQWRRDNVDLTCVKEGAVIYHPDKKGVLFDDGLIPNGAGGDPQTGVPCEGSPHETKDKPNLYLETAKMLNDLCEEEEQNELSLAIEQIIYCAKNNPKIKKQVISRLIKEGIIPQTKSPKQSRKKVRPSVGKRGRPKSGSGVPIPSDSQVEG
jgi:hypothetical protein